MRMPFLDAESQDPEGPIQSIKEPTEPRGGAPLSVGRDSFVNAVAVNKCADSESIVPDIEEVLKLQTADEDISMILPVAICLLIKSKHREWCQRASCSVSLKKSCIEKTLCFLVGIVLLS